MNLENTIIEKSDNILKGKFENFCRIYYETMCFDAKTENFENIYDKLMKDLAKFDVNFSNIVLDKFTSEIISLLFEIFALAWIHKFGVESAIEQSRFTKNYLHGRGADRIWDGMKHYNEGVSASITVNLRDQKKALIIKMRADLADKYIAIAESQGIDVDESLGRPINRVFFEDAWEKGTTIDLLILSLCHNLGLGYGPKYLGPNKDAKNFLSLWIQYHYNTAYKLLNDAEIEKII